MDRIIPCYGTGTWLIKPLERSPFILQVILDFGRGTGVEIQGAVDSMIETYRMGQVSIGSLDIPSPHLDISRPGSRCRAVAVRKLADRLLILECTSGAMFGSVKFNIAWLEHLRLTKEYAVCRSSKAFAQERDSDAFVLNKAGEFVGILVVRTKDNTGAADAMTTIQAVIDGIWSIRERGAFMLIYRA